jgi:hypothetical protein
MLNLPKSYSIKVHTSRSVEVCIHIFLTLAVGGGERQVNAPTNLLVEKQPSVYTG